MYPPLISHLWQPWTLDWTSGPCMTFLNGSQISLFDGHLCVTQIPTASLTISTTKSPQRRSNDDCSDSYVMTTRVTTTAIATRMSAVKVITAMIQRWGWEQSLQHRWRMTLATTTGVVGSSALEVKVGVSLIWHLYRDLYIINSCPCFTIYCGEMFQVNKISSKSSAKLTLKLLQKVQALGMEPSAGCSKKIPRCTRYSILITFVSLSCAIWIIWWTQIMDLGVILSLQREGRALILTCKWCTCRCTPVHVRIQGRFRLHNKVITSFPKQKRASTIKKPADHDGRAHCVTSRGTPIVPSRCVA